ncbi:MAG: hypothetical protein AAF488_13235 [Planctomycetota bacterium]
MIAALILPVIGIVIVGILLFNRTTEVPEPVVKDDNVKIQKLIDEIRDLEKLGSSAVKAFREEKPSRKKLAEEFEKRTGDWLDEWELLTREFRTDNGSGPLKKEYAGYGDHFNRVSKLRQRVSKDTGF